MVQRLHLSETLTRPQPPVRCRNPPPKPARQRRPASLPAESRSPRTRSRRCAAPCSPSSRSTWARIPTMPATATGSSRRRSRCATASSSTGWRPTAGCSGRAGKRVYYLSLEFLIGRLLRDFVHAFGLTEALRGRARRPRRQCRSHVPGRARRGARQWRPRAARRLLHGEHGDARHPRLRLRHPLRPRPVPPGHQERRAAGISGGLAVLRQSLGVRAPGDHPRHRLRRLGRADAAAGRRVAGRVASDRDGRGGRLRHADRRLARRGTSIRSASGRRAPSIRCGSTSSIPATISARSASRRGPRRSRKSSIRRTPPPPARSCGSGRNISSSPPRCRIWCGVTSASMATSARSPRRPRSSSTTRIRASRSPS